MGKQTIILLLENITNESKWADDKKCKKKFVSHKKEKI